MSNKTAPPPLQPLITTRDTSANSMEGNKITKHIKRDKHPLIKMRFNQSMFNDNVHLEQNRNKNRNRNNNCVQPQHPHPHKQIEKKDMFTDHETGAQFSNESDNSISCSELTYIMNMAGHDNKSFPIDTENMDKKENIENTFEDGSKYKAFVVMNGNTKTIASENKRGSIVIENDANANANANTNTNAKEAIVIGECSNQMICENAINNDDKLVDNVINEASNLCLEENAFKMIGDNVIRTNKIESLIHKMGSYQTNTRNPVTNKFSTYYQRSESIGGTLLKSEQIANKYIDKEDMMPMHEGDTIHCDATIATTRTRTRLEQQNYKKAKKYSAPSDELTRLQIREDIRKMRNPNLNEIKIILSAIGLKQFMNHKAYIGLAHAHAQAEAEAHDNEVQFIGINTAKDKKKKKKKRRQRNYDYSYDYDYDYYGYQNSVFSISSEALPSALPLPLPLPLPKKQKVSDEPIKCNQCNKIFTLEVDLLLHRTNDRC